MGCKKQAELDADSVSNPRPKSAVWARSWGMCTQLFIHAKKFHCGKTAWKPCLKSTPSCKFFRCSFRNVAAVLVGLICVSAVRCGIRIKVTCHFFPASWVSLWKLHSNEWESEWNWILTWNPRPIPRENTIKKRWPLYSNMSSFTMWRKLPWYFISLWRPVLFLIWLSYIFFLSILRNRGVFQL